MNELKPIDLLRNDNKYASIESDVKTTIFKNPNGTSTKKITGSFEKTEWDSTTPIDIDKVENNDATTSADEERLYQLAGVSQNVEAPSNSQLEQDKDSLKADMNLISYNDENDENDNVLEASDGKAVIDMIRSPDIAIEDNKHIEANKNVYQTKEELETLIKRTIDDGHFNINLLFKKNRGGMYYTARIRDGVLSNIEMPTGDIVKTIEEVYNEKLSESIDNEDYIELDGTIEYIDPEKEDNEDYLADIIQWNANVDKTGKIIELGLCDEWGDEVEFDDLPENIKNDIEEDVKREFEAKENINSELKPGEELLLELPETKKDFEIVSMKDIGKVEDIGNINFPLNRLILTFGRPTEKSSDNCDVQWFLKIRNIPVTIRNDSKYDAENDVCEVNNWIVASSDKKALDMVKKIIDDEPLTENVSATVIDDINNKVNDIQNNLHLLYKTIIRTGYSCDLEKLTHSMQMFNHFNKSCNQMLENNVPELHIYDDESIKAGNNQPETVEIEADDEK